MNKQKSKQPRFNRITNISIAYFAYFILPLAVIFPLRKIGFLQPLEAIALDTIIRSRPTEPADKRITIVGIDEEDLNYLKNRKELVGDAISDAALAQTLTKISTLKPAAIGLDVGRDIEMGSVEDRRQLKKVFNQEPKNMIEGYKRGNPDQILPVLPESEKSGVYQVGFIDDPLDKDGRARRTILAIPEQGFYSLAFQVSRLYLQNHQLSIESKDGQISIKGKKFDSLQLTPATYIEESNSGELQLLVNYRNHPKPFNIISLRDTISGKFNANIVKDRIVLIGYTAHSKHDFDHSNAIKIDPQVNSNRIPTLLYGVEYHAHIISQLLSRVLDDRPNIYPLDIPFDILWLLGCTSLGLVISKLLPINNLSIRITISILINIVSIGSIAYLLIICGIWVPIAATIVSLIISTPALVTAYEREQQIKAIARGQLDVLEISYQNIHARPLQTIGGLIRDLSGSDPIADIRGIEVLKQIDLEIRDIGDELLEKYQDGDKYPLLKSAREQNPTPLNEMLRLTYDRKISKNSQNYLNHIDFSISNIEFNLFPDNGLTLNDKNNICYALDECLTNIDKYAEGATRIVVQTKIKDGICSLEIADNGKNALEPSKLGRGTKDMKRNAKRLGGDFIRMPNQPRGCKCIFSWQTSRSISIASLITSIRNN